MKPIVTFLTAHAADPLEWLQKNPETERPNHILFVDHYGNFPFAALPRTYKAAVAKFGRTKLEASGVLPWQIGVYSAKLTDALRAGNWDQARILAATLAGYVAEAYDPFNTTENFDGHLSNQPGVNSRFSSNLVDRYSLFLPMRPNDATYISDPTDHAFEACLSSHGWLENVLLADRRARAGLPITPTTITTVSTIKSAPHSFASSATPPTTSAPTGSPPGSTPGARPRRVTATLPSPPPAAAASRHARSDQFRPRPRRLPKAELHLHMEGAIAPATVVELAARYGSAFDESTVFARYRSRDFMGFLDAYKWATSYLRAPEDYALVAQRLCESLLSQNHRLRRSHPLRRRHAAAPAGHRRQFPRHPRGCPSLRSRGLRLQWILDVIRQFGAAPAWEVARSPPASTEGVVAFGMGGDELALPAARISPRLRLCRRARIASSRSRRRNRRTESVREAVELLGAERIGHGIAAARDPQLVALLAERSIPLEICPTSNLRTGALARQLRRLRQPLLAEHPLPDSFAPASPSTSPPTIPAMFETHLLGEYARALRDGAHSPEIVRLAEAAFRHAFLPLDEKSRLLDTLCRAGPSPRPAIIARMKAHVWVMLKSTVLDPQGTAIQHALASLGSIGSRRPPGQVFRARAQRPRSRRRAGRGRTYRPRSPHQSRHRGISLRNRRMALPALPTRRPPAPPWRQARALSRKSSRLRPSRRGV